LFYPEHSVSVANISPHIRSTFGCWNASRHFNFSPQMSPLCQQIRPQAGRYFLTELRGRFDPIGQRNWASDV